MFIAMFGICLSSILYPTRLAGNITNVAPLVRQSDRRHYLAKALTHLAHELAINDGFSRLRQVTMVLQPYHPRISHPNGGCPRAVISFNLFFYLVFRTSSPQRCGGILTSWSGATAPSGQSFSSTPKNLLLRDDCALGRAVPSTNLNRESHAGWEVIWT